MSRGRTLADVSQFLARCLSAWYSQGRWCSLSNHEEDVGIENSRRESTRVWGWFVRSESVRKRTETRVEQQHGRSESRREIYIDTSRDQIFDACAPSPQLTETCRLTGFFAFSHLDAKDSRWSVQRRSRDTEGHPGIRREKPGRQRDTLSELVSGQSCVLSNTFFLLRLFLNVRARSSKSSIDRFDRFSLSPARSFKITITKRITNLK